MKSVEKLAKFVEEKMAEHGIPGVSIGLLLGDEHHILNFGVTSIENPLPVTDETLFQIGSNTKTMTATLMMMLAEAGQLDLDASIRAILPDFQVADEVVAATATIRQLVTHSVGWVGDHFIETGAGADASALYVASMADLPQLAPPKYAFSYNNSAFAVAGHIIEMVTAQPYATAMREMLFEPLGMEQSLFDAGDVMLRRFAVGHDIYPDKPVTVAGPWPLPKAMYAAGAVAATAWDMLTFARFYLDQGRTQSGTQLLSPAGMKTMWTPQFETGVQGGSVCHSWFMQQEDGLLTYSHGGATVGQMSAFKIVPEKEFAFVSLTNGSTGTLFNREVEKQILAEFCGIQPREPEIVEPTEEALAELAGCYSRPMADLELTLQDGQLVARIIAKQGFPAKEDPPRPPTPLFAVGLLASGDLLALDGPVKGAQFQVLRLEDGSIGWIRGGMRLHRKVADC